MFRTVSATLCFVVGTTMANHICNRDNCRPNLVNGPSIKCSRCNNVCFLKCYGIDKDGINDSVIKIGLPDGGMIRVEISQCQFQCCICSPPIEPKSTEPKSAELKSQTNEQKSTTKGKNASSTSRQPLITNFSETNHKLMTDISEIKKVLSDLKISSDKIVTELVTVKGASTETNALVKKVTDNNVKANQLLSTPNRYPFSGLRTTSAAKRKLDDSNNQNQSPKISANLIPKPKEGTRDINIGPTPTARLSGGNNNKPLLDKSIWVSGLDPSVSNETMIDFIMNNTQVKTKDEFKCHKLVKKDCDISKLSYISFKIDVKQDLFDYLVDPNIWPKHVSVREFIKAQPVKLNEFINREVDEHAEKLRKVDEQKNQTNQANEGERGMDLN